MNKFYLVWNESGGMPKIMHDNLQNAKDEAERIANKHPGDEVVVLESIGSFRVKNVVWESHEN